MCIVTLSHVDTFQKMADGDAPSKIDGGAYNHSMRILERERAKLLMASGLRPCNLFCMAFLACPRNPNDN